METLAEHLERYLALRRSVGYQLVEGGRLLPDFVRYARLRGETTVRTRCALAWAAAGSNEPQVARRLSAVRGFARYLTAFDATTQVPGRGLVPNASVRSTPHIYSDEEVAQLMELAHELRPEAFGATMATLIGLMSATGLRPFEVRRLDRSHVDLAKAQLSGWHFKSGRSRRLPLHASTVDALGEYAAVSQRWHPRRSDDAFFLGRSGARLSKGVAARAFRQLRSDVPLVSATGQRPAVLGDLRHTFAVSTLLSWHRAGVDVERRLPVLSAYLGHVNPAQTYWYLEGTPELMALVAERLERSTEAGQ
jgi:integrase/recombinase XerD